MISVHLLTLILINFMVVTVLMNFKTLLVKVFLNLASKALTVTQICYSTVIIYPLFP